MTRKAIAAEASSPCRKMAAPMAAITTNPIIAAIEKRNGCIEVASQSDATVMQSPPGARPRERAPECPPRRSPSVP